MVSEVLEVVLSNIKMIGYRPSIKALIVVRDEVILPFYIKLIIMNINLV